MMVCLDNLRAVATILRPMQMRINLTVRVRFPDKSKNIIHAFTTDEYLHASNYTMPAQASSSHHSVPSVFFFAMG
jgi:hypothetical protein